MAVTPTVVATGAGIAGQTNAHQLIRVVDILFDSSYPTGGEAIDFTNLGFATVQAVCDGGGTTHLGYLIAYDFTNSKLKVYTTGAAANAIFNEAPNTTDLSAATFRVVVIGTSA